MWELQNCGIFAIAELAVRMFSSSKCFIKFCKIHWKATILESLFNMVEGLQLQSQITGLTEHQRKAVSITASSKRTSRRNGEDLEFV